MLRVPLTILGSATIILASALASAPMAQAYPPGGNPAFFTNKTDVKKGSKFTSRVTNVGDGCKVRFQIRDANGNKISSSVRTVKNGHKGLHLNAPGKSGTFYLGILVYGATCTSKSSTIIKMNAS